jgi:hypothetical protein
MRIIIKVIICLLALSSPCWAATWYVDNSVGSSGSGSQLSPWKNLSDISWGSVTAGDTINVSGGSTSQTYNETLTFSKGVTVQKNQNYAGTPIINGQATRSYGVVLVANATIDGFEIYNHTDTAIVAEQNYITIKNCTIHETGNEAIPTGWGISISGSHITITNNNIYDNYSIAIAAPGKCDYADIGSNTFGADAGWSVGPQGSYVKIHDNIFADPGSYYCTTDVHVNMIFVAQNNEGQTLTDYRVYNNLFYATGPPGNCGCATAALQIASSYQTISNATFDGLYIFNNRFVNISAVGPILISSNHATMKNIYILNNSIWESTSYAFQCSGIMLYDDASEYMPWTNLVVKNNNVKVGNTSLIYIPQTKLISADINYNNYNSSYSAPLNAAGANKTLAQWKELGYDASSSSTTANNYFTNASENTHDLTLTQHIQGDNLSSLCTSLGIPELCYDAAGSPRSAWSIGAYEYAVSAVGTITGITISPGVTFR